MGKTTFARRLERELGAVRFTPDEWMSQLFGADPPADLFQNGAEQIAVLLGRMWRRCLAVGVDVVLDYGFWTKRERDEVREEVLASGAEVVLYRVTCSEAEARRRLAARNDQLNGSLHIAPATFDILKARFEPLLPDEPRTELVQG